MTDQENKRKIPLRIGSIYDIFLFEILFVLIVYYIISLFL
jgi:hypothetical protein